MDDIELPPASVQPIVWSASASRLEIVGDSAQDLRAAVLRDRKRRAIANSDSNARALAEMVLERVDEPPDRNCSCHISPPCNDCITFGGLRELFESARETLALTEEQGNE